MTHMYIRVHFVKECGIGPRNSMLLKKGHSSSDKIEAYGHRENRGKRCMAISPEDAVQNNTFSQKHSILRAALMNCGVAKVHIDGSFPATHMDTACARFATGDCHNLTGHLHLGQQSVLRHTRTSKGCSVT